jgi:hypothetical protein
MAKAWDYRIAVNVDGDCYDVIEVYYDNSGKIEGWCAASVSGWEHKEDIKYTLERMLLAFNKPPVKLEDEVAREYE